MTDVYRTARSINVPGAAPGQQCSIKEMMYDTRQMTVDILKRMDFFAKYAV